MVIRSAIGTTYDDWIQHLSDCVQSGFFMHLSRARQDRVGWSGVEIEFFCCFFIQERAQSPVAGAPDVVLCGREQCLTVGGACGFFSQSNTQGGWRCVRAGSASLGNRSFFRGHLCLIFEVRRDPSAPSHAVSNEVARWKLGKATCKSGAQLQLIRGYHGARFETEGVEY
ncbi:uncharacterized protein K452DRAFT_39756 [Aplosporella prunicola CBS 121167]|uniref:Uncharacterized protein n=1 Tax=Aplosporella prunicola CBS 121167 TaxID=1176127 RepID=A0A6A6BEY4_9PEZI|nr:uncharacterized protein K452DRAFT_39756 [Aplosporella prunicola CBS 121167]KAF2141457.1 hypothetical protein K452DRAFT_39756 [Aplosporella prunicola CBS 121167]